MHILTKKIFEGNMEIYVVQPNDTIYSIARAYNVPVDILIRNNQLDDPENLVPGQTIVIVYPLETYTVKEGDTVSKVASEHNITQMQLLRNNPFIINNRLFPGEDLTIRYNTFGSISTIGYVYPYIDKTILKKTLPDLTYISIYNYRIINEGEIINYGDDSEVIQLAKEYGTIPLMVTTTLSEQGEADVETNYGLLLNETFQDNFINNAINIMKEKGYLGLNTVLNNLNSNALSFCEKMVARFNARLESEGFIFFITVNPNIRYVNNVVYFDRIDYSKLGESVDYLVFLEFIWGTNFGPPLPVNSIFKLRSLVENAITTIDSKKLMVGYSLISYDWALPYVPGISYTNSLSIKDSIRLAQGEGATINFDEVSQSPYFNYFQSENIEHIVWTVDARSIEALTNLVIEDNLSGAGFWNLMIYTAQLWLVIDSQFEVVKLLPNIFDNPEAFSPSNNN